MLGFSFLLELPELFMEPSLCVEVDQTLEL